MQTRYFKEYSPSLGRDMECKIYGHAGRPLVFIPCQDGRFFSFEDFHMSDTMAPWLESGRLMVIAIDTIDQETWSDMNGDPWQRIRRHEAWMNYIFTEVAPKAQQLSRMVNGESAEHRPLSFGCSLGALHAANLYLRRPDLFSGMLALAGIYTARYGFGSYMDEIVYQNSPVDYMAQLPQDHPYIPMFNRQRAVICTGQGAWEQPETTRTLKDIFERKGIHLWVDLWGHDVNHDWPWWYKQTEYFLPWLLNERNG